MVNLRLKLDKKSDKCIFIGYCNHSKAYRLYNPISVKVVISRNVVFNEEASWEQTGTRSTIDHVPADIDGEMVEVSPPATPHMTSPSSTSPSTPATSSTSPASSNNSETPPKKFRNLQEIYASCSFAL